jgi:hypothetical protein
MNLDGIKIGNNVIFRRESGKSNLVFLNFL